MPLPPRVGTSQNWETPVYSPLGPAGACGCGMYLSGYVREIANDLTSFVYRENSAVKLFSEKQVFVMLRHRGIATGYVSSVDAVGCRVMMNRFNTGYYILLG